MGGLVSCKYLHPPNRDGNVVNVFLFSKTIVYIPRLKNLICTIMNHNCLESVASLFDCRLF